jgi:hypothetical protein
MAIGAGMKILRLYAALPNPLSTEMSPTKSFLVFLKMAFVKVLTQMNLHQKTNYE